MLADFNPFIVYFSSLSNNTHRFVKKLPFPAFRIPLKVVSDPETMTHPYVLVTPTYGGGKPTSGVRGKYVPIQVIKFLNKLENRQNLLGVIAGGNSNFGTEYGIAGNIISIKCQVPYLYKFELMGTKTDVENVSAGLKKLWKKEKNGW